MFANNRLNVFASGYHKSQVRLKSDNDGLRGSLLDTPPTSRSNGGGEISYEGQSYLSHITKKAVLCLQVLGGRMLHTPCLPRFQVIVIATSDWRLIGICLAPLFMVKFLHFCSDVGLVENV